ncbi:MAG: M23 family metallopeptidase, partial [Candidatus Stahlbacteria bacterium]|nr:M23 family metallopeptidase [Candidatus Stahlbacteria bacterium]
VIKMRYWTIRIGSKWLHISLYQLIGIGVIGGGIIFYSVSAAFLSINANINAGKFIREKNRSIELGIALSNLKDKIDSVNMKLTWLIDLDCKERLVWGLPNISADIRKLGIGGRHTPTSPIRGVIQELSRKINFETASFDEIYGQIDSKKKALFHTPSIWPTDGSVTSGFGWRWFSGREFHNGIDIANSQGTPVKSTASGVVDYVGYQGGLGLIVEIDHGFGYMTRYGHLSRASVEAGDMIERGQVIGAIGVTGRTTGAHLHYEVCVLGKAIDPASYIIPGSATY